MPRRQLRNRIALWYGVTLLAVLGSALLLMHLRIGAETEIQVVREMHNGVAVLGYLLQARAETLEATARSIGDLPKLSAALGTHDPRTVQDVAREYPVLARCDFLMLTDARGIVLAHTAASQRIGQDASRERGVAEALQGRTQVEVRPEGRQLFQIASAPARAGGELIGTVHLGFALNNAFAARLQRASGVDLTLLVGRSIRASTLDSTARVELISELERGDRLPTVRPPTSLAFMVSMRGQQHLTLIEAMADASGKQVGAYVIQKSVDYALSPYRSIQQWLIAIGMVGLALGVVASTLLARGITEPILRVAQAAEALSRGDWTQRVFSSSVDEVGVLARTFNAMAARLQTWDADLRAAVAERTAELNEAVVQLDAAFEQMRRFHADASHELRTPLTILRGEAEVALRAPRSPLEYQRVLASLLEEAELMAHIVDQLLTLARADSGELTIEKEWVCLSVLLEELYEQAQVLARAKRIELRTINGGTLHTTGDELRLRQLFLNLIDNAVKYTAPRGRIWLEAKQERGRPVIRVRDTGIGIAAEHLPHLFERFFRVDKARSREVGGSGLGLAICKWIVDAHGGTIEVESEPEVGTTVTVRLPAAEEGGGQWSVVSGQSENRKAGSSSSTDD